MTRLHHSAKEAHEAVVMVLSSSSTLGNSSLQDQWDMLTKKNRVNESYPEGLLENQAFIRGKSAWDRFRFMILVYLGMTLGLSVFYVVVFFVIGKTQGPIASYITSLVLNFGLTSGMVMFLLFLEIYYMTFLRAMALFSQKERSLYVAAFAIPGTYCSWALLISLGFRIYSAKTKNLDTVDSQDISSYPDSEGFYTCYIMGITVLTSYTLLYSFFIAEEMDADAKRYAHDSLKQLDTPTIAHISSNSISAPLSAQGALLGNTGTTTITSNVPIHLA
ncbi:hypothetical protein NP233_g7727 [Leucocoprinus birnbaumii]|uniref:Uncharacterized protein n=1 Tax=Leucocoprinus birnbaumii TaxID=56174 RepID=A0AAD5VRC1_9AGAR|nr:hypothetical protein NP233_g7727 [Leucocoprinus birnbaumii]